MKEHKFNLSVGDTKTLSLSGATFIRVIESTHPVKLINNGGDSVSIDMTMQTGKGYKLARPVNTLQFENLGDTDNNVVIEYGNGEIYDNALTGTVSVVAGGGAPLQAELAGVSQDTPLPIYTAREPVYKPITLFEFQRDDSPVGDIGGGFEAFDMSSITLAENEEIVGYWYSYVPQIVTAPATELDGLNYYVGTVDYAAYANAAAARVQIDGHEFYVYPNQQGYLEQTATAETLNSSIAYVSPASDMVLRITAKVRVYQQ